VVDDGHGIYSAQVFCERFGDDIVMPDNKDEQKSLKESIAIVLKGPDEDLYCEAWDDVTENEVELDNIRYTIDQDGGIRLIPVDFVWDEDEDGHRQPTGEEILDDMLIPQNFHTLKPEDQMRLVLGVEGRENLVKMANVYLDAREKLAETTDGETSYDHNEWSFLKALSYACQHCWSGADEVMSLHGRIGYSPGAGVMTDDEDIDDEENHDAGMCRVWYNHFCAQFLEWNCPKCGRRDTYKSDEFEQCCSTCDE
jgi:hypothetical protein